MTAAKKDAAKQVDSAKTDNTVTQDNEKSEQERVTVILKGSIQLKPNSKPISGKQEFSQEEANYLVENKLAVIPEK